MDIEFYAVSFLRARCYASAVPAVIVSVRLYGLLHAGIVPKRLNVASRKQSHVIAQGV